MIVDGAIVDPFLAEQITHLLAKSPQPISAHRLETALGGQSEGVYGGAVMAALRALIAEGLIVPTPGGYVATDLGRQRASEALVASMDMDVQDDSDALVASLSASMAALDPDTHVSLLASQMYSMDPEPYKERMAPHLDRAQRHFADARRYDSGHFADGRGRARRSRLAALDSLTAAVRIVDPTKSRRDVLRAAFRAAPPSAIVAALVASSPSRPAALVASAAPAPVVSGEADLRKALVVSRKRMAEARRNPTTDSLTAALAAGTRVRTLLAGMKR